MNNSEVHKKVMKSSSIDLSQLNSISELACGENKIPKIIHFCFLDYRNITDLHLNYIKTWFEILDDTWTFVNWTPELVEPVCDFERFTIENNKFAFYADYIRCARVYEYGGVYLDCDVRMIKSPEPLLDFDYVFDREFDLGYIECASFMAKRNNRFLGIIKNFYENTTPEEYLKQPRDFLAPRLWPDVLCKNGVTTGLSSTSDLDEYRSFLSLNYNHILYTLDGTYLSCPCKRSNYTGKMNFLREHTFTTHGFENTWSY